MKLITLFFYLFSPQTLVITGKINVSGKTQLGTTESCMPTAAQLANRVSTSGIAIPPYPALPSPGHIYCDPTYGTAVLRVSDNANLDNSIAVLGQVGFNKTSTRIATIVNGGYLRIYTFNPTTMLSGATGTTVDPIYASTGGLLGFNSAAFFWSFSADSDAADTILMAAGMSLYKVNITYTDGSGHYIAYKIADFSSLATSLSQPALQRCSMTNDSGILACAILDANASTPYARVGYVIANILSQSTASPTTNWTTIKKFVNGVDSGSIGTYESITRTGSDMVSYTYTYTSPVEVGIGAQGGYKFWVDRGGNYAIFLAYSSSDSGVTSGAYNTQVIMNLSTFAITFAQASGHGDPGFGTYVGENTVFGTCQSCMKVWNLSSMTTDPAPTSNNGTAITAALGYNVGRQYNTNFNSSNNLSVAILACVVGGCPSTPDPYVGDVYSMNITGVQQTQRLARLNHYLDSGDYTELQPAMSRDGKFVAYTSNYGGVAFTNYVFVTRVF